MERWIALHLGEWPVMMIGLESATFHVRTIRNNRTPKITMRLQQLKLRDSKLRERQIN